MIEFKGLLTGTAKKRFRRRCYIMGQNLMLFAVATLFPVMFSISFSTGYWLLMGGYAAFAILAPLMMWIPKGEREWKSLTPKRIYVDNGIIVCIADKYEEARKIKDVKYVKETDAYYELVFPFGKVSEKFICQKDLLTKGSLTSFEALFEGKIKCKTR